MQVSDKLGVVVLTTISMDAFSLYSSTLASIFGTSRAMDAGGNASLTYTAPKQPKKQSKCKPVAKLLYICVSKLLYVCSCVCVLNMVPYPSV